MPRPIVIVGAGPAGLVLANVLHAAGLDCVLLERRERADVEARVRAGIITGQTVAILDRHGLSGPLRAAAARQNTCEFRTPGESLVVDYPDAHFVYPQHLLLRDLIEAFAARGGDLRFGTAVTAVQPGLVSIGPENRQIRASLIVDCAGRHGPTAKLFPAVVRQYPYRWRSVLIGAPPATPHLTYALHPDGFAGQMPRTPQSTRYYLQEPVDSELFPALERRLGAAVPRGPILHEDQVTMTASITGRMTHGTIHLAGDAAHSLPPAGAKGLNLAVADAEDLAEAVIVGGDRLHGYERRRLSAAWNAASFVDWLLSLVNTPDGPGRSFLHRISQSRLAGLRDSPGLIRWFTQAYAGGPAEE